MCEDHLPAVRIHSEILDCVTISRSISNRLKQGVRRIAQTPPCPLLSSDCGKVIIDSLMKSTVESSAIFDSRWTVRVSIFWPSSARLCDHGSSLPDSLVYPPTVASSGSSPQL